MATLEGKIEALQFTLLSDERPPTLIEVDGKSWGARVEAFPRPVVLVLRSEDLDRLLADPSFRRLVQVRVQNDTKGLRRSLSETGCIALHGKYETPGRLEAAVVGFLERCGATHRGVYLIGVDARVFEGLMALLRGRAKAPQPNTPAWHHWVDAQIARRFPGESPEARGVRQLIKSACVPEAEELVVLLLGPTGAGKTVVAGIIHDLTRGVRGEPFVRINCAEFAENVLEAEVFGIEDHFATGVQARMGLWEQAKRGTFFMDEIGDATHGLQAKILTTFDRREIRRVGGRVAIPVDARIIVATNRNLYQMVAEKRFRADLVHRLNGIPIRIPGLSERRGDIPLIAQRFWTEIAQTPGARLTAEVLSFLESQDWPGNQRDLYWLLRQVWVQSLMQPVPSVDQVMQARRQRDSVWSSAPERDARSSAPVPRTPAAEAGIHEHVDAFRRIRPRYERLERVLKEILERAADERAPLGIVQARTKSLARFAEKIQRERYADPIDELRDLCGGRVIVHTEEQVRAMREFLERYFEVEDAGPRDATDAGDVPAGLSSVTRNVRLDRARAQELGFAHKVEIPDEVCGLWAEVQVRTVLQHAWLDAVQMIRDIPLRPPAKWASELQEVAGVLLAVDRAFSRIRTGFAVYRTSYSSYLTKDEIEREIELLSRVLDCEADPSVAERLGKFAISVGDWERAIAVLEPYAEAGYQPAMRDLGVALCQKHRTDTESALYARGQRFLQRACDPPHRDLDALGSLAGTLKRCGQWETALELYRQGFAIDPADPYALGGVLESELVLRPEADIVTVLRPEMEASIERCRDHIAARVNFPWAYYSLGRFLLLTGQVEEGLRAVELAIDHSTTEFMIKTTLESYENLAKCGDRYPGLAQARTLLQDALAAWEAKTK